jgi:hypothetical protein
MRRRLGTGEQDAELLKASVTFECNGCHRALRFADRKAGSGCKSAFYHNRECQVMHWKSHKPECSKDGSRLESEIRRRQEMIFGK